MTTRSQRYGDAEPTRMVLPDSASNDIAYCEEFNALGGFEFIDWQRDTAAATLGI